jgi:hypothetical protein
MHWHCRSQGLQQGKLLLISLIVFPQLAQGPSVQGKTQFIGCSRWANNDGIRHIYLEIPENVDEKELMHMIASEGAHTTATTTPACSHLSHARSGATTCRELILC